MLEDNWKLNLWRTNIFNAYCKGCKHSGLVALLFHLLVHVYFCFFQNIQSESSELVKLHKTKTYNNEIIDVTWFKRLETRSVSRLLLRYVHVSIIQLCWTLSTVAYINDSQKIFNFPLVLHQPEFCFF